MKQYWVTDIFLNTELKATGRDSRKSLLIEGIQIFQQRMLLIFSPSSELAVGTQYPYYLLAVQLFWKHKLNMDRIGIANLTINQVSCFF
jgi:hypothetical protein